MFGDVASQRRALAARLGLPAGQADDLSRWVLAHPDQFDADELRCWRIASPTWLAVAGEQLEAVDRVERPVALFVMPAVRGRGVAADPGALAGRDPPVRLARRAARARPALRSRYRPRSRAS